MKNDNQHIMSEELLSRYFSNDASDEERDLVKVWRNQSTENQSKYDESYIFHLDIKAINSLKNTKPTTNENELWEKFKKSNLIKETPKKLSVEISRSALKYAASLLLLILAGWFYFEKQDNETTNVIAESDVKVLNLNDGSKVTLNQYSSLEYIKSFNKDNRVVELKGEAYFEVEHDKSKPFKIKVNNSEITVLGTSFNVKSTPDSTIVHVDEGIVSLSAFDKRTLLRKGEFASVCLSNTKVSQAFVVDDDDYNFWRTKSLVFNNSKLTDVIKSINRHYQSEITLANSKVGNCTITVSFANQNLDDIIEIIANTLQLDILKSKNKTTLNGIGCE